MKGIIKKFMTSVIITSCIFNSNIYAGDNKPGENTEENKAGYYNTSYDDYIESIKDLKGDKYKFKLSMAPSKYSYNETAEIDTKTRKQQIYYLPVLLMIVICQ